MGLPADLRYPGSFIAIEESLPNSIFQFLPSREP